MPPKMSPPRAQQHGGVSSGGSAFDLDMSLCDVPLDIKPPSPKRAPKKMASSHTPYLHTAEAKEAFKDSTLRSHNITATRLSHGVRPVSTDPSQSMLHGSKGDRRHVSGHDSLPSPTHSTSGHGGRSSVEPQMSSELSEEQVDRLSVKLERRSLSKSKLAGGIKKANPAMFALEAEQRALEGQQKMMEKDAFERKRNEATIHVQNLQKQCNDLKKHRGDMERELALLYDRKAALDAETQSEEHRTAAHNALRIQDLSAKLEYWTMALQEEEAYSKTLHHMKRRAADDKHRRDNETAKFTEEVKAYEHDLLALKERYHEAKNEEMASEKQLNDYWDEMDVYRSRRDLRLNDRKSQVEKMKQREAAMQKIQKIEEEAARKKEEQDRAANKKQMEEKRITDARAEHLRGAFDKMMSISGIQTVEELADSFINREAKETKFLELLERNQDKIHRLTDERQELDLELLKVKFSGSSNDADRDEIKECEQEIVRVKRETSEKKKKQAGTEAILVRSRSAFEFLANKLREVELDQERVEEILAAAQAREQDSTPEEEIVVAGDDTGSDEEEDDENKSAELSIEAGDGLQNISEIKEGEATELQEAGDENAQMGPQEIKMEMKKVQDPKTGVIAKLRESMAKLDYMYQHLAKNKGGVPAQSKQNAEAKASGTRNLEDWLSTQGMEMKTITLKDAKFNYRLPLQRDKSSPRRTDEDDDEEEMDDRGSIKKKADVMVNKKRRELAAMLDEDGNPRFDSSTAKKR